jgi:predicted neuraminidase
MTAWWSGSCEGGTDVVIKAARLRSGAETWDPATTVADVPERFQGNPVLFSLPDGRLWLFFVIIHFRGPQGVQIVFSESIDLGHTWGPIEEFVTERGIRTRNHPILIPNGEILFPLHGHGTGASIFLLSGDPGQTWDRSAPILSEPGNAQPTVISRGNGELYALMRTWNEDPNKRFLWQSESYDYGRSWTPPTYSQIPTVSSAIEMVRLENGHVVLAYNDGQGRERTPLTLALSVDGGRTWTCKRDLETGEGSFSYPSIIQARDGNIHVTYSYRRLFIKHVEVNEAWIGGGER